MTYRRLILPGVLAFFFSLCSAGTSLAQNIQLHYDLGSSLYPNELSARPKLTTTAELFKADKWGNTFYFVDMDYAKGGIRSAYWELSRELKFWDTPVSIHLEYDGGLSNRFSYSDAYLLGATYAYHTSDYSFTLGITPMYKYLRGNGKPHAFQLTAVWGYTFAKGLLSFNGFMDFWTNRDLKDTAPVVFLTEPQIWLNLNAIEGISPDFNLSVGSEVEMSYNFVGSKFYALPTIALKWTF